MPSSAKKGFSALDVDSITQLWAFRELCNNNVARVSLADCFLAGGSLYFFGLETGIATPSPWQRLIGGHRLAVRARDVAVCPSAPGRKQDLMEQLQR